MSERDSLLVSRTLDGDNTAFDELVERYRGRVFRSAMNKLAIREEAVDVTQEAFVRAYMSLHSLKNPERFGPWLMTIVGNLCKMQFRSSRETPVPPEALETVSAAARDPEAIRVAEALESLPEGTRVAASLFFVEGLEQQEIAARLGISLPAVKSRVREARLRLRKEMVDMATKPKSRGELGEEFASELKQKLELARWFKEIADHLTSGGDVMTGLEAIAKGGYSAPVMDATVNMMDAIRSGKSVSSALADIPVLASPEAVALARAGEEFGSLHIAIRYLSDWFKVQDAQRQIELILWCRTFGFLLSAGVPLLETLDYGIGIARSKALRQATRDMVNAVEKTRSEQPTTSPLRPVLDRYSDVFPPICRAAILVGEWGGALDLTLQWSADAMADDLAQDIARSPVGTTPELPPRAPGYIPEIPKTLQGAVRLLSDPAPDIRAAAIDILGRIGYKESASDIAAIDSITKLELHSAAPAVAEAIRDSDLRVAMAAIDSLQALKETDVMKRKAVEMLESESREGFPGDEHRYQKRGAYLLRYFLPPEVLHDVVKPLEERADRLSESEMNQVIALGLYGVVEVRPILNVLVKDPRCSAPAARALQEIERVDQNR